MDPCPDGQAVKDRNRGGGNRLQRAVQLSLRVANGEGGGGWGTEVEGERYIKTVERGDRDI